MLEVDIDDSGTVDFFEFLCVARLIAQGKGMYKASDRKNKRIYHSYLKFVLRAHREREYAIILELRSIQRNLKTVFFILKTHQMFSVHTTPEEFRNATIIGHFGFVFEEDSGREIT